MIDTATHRLQASAAGTGRVSGRRGYTADGTPDE